MIKTTKALQSLVARAMRADCVALDTEFMMGQTYFPRLGLIQVGFAEEDVFLIDPFSVKDLSPLGILLRSGDVVKVLHDAEHDLALLHTATGAMPRNIFDTQRAAGFTDLPCTLSLANLILALFDIALDKSETRSDWLRRPLSARQCAYARSDVRYLCQAYRELTERAASAGRTAWLMEEMQRYDDEMLYTPPDPQDEYLRLGGAGSLSGVQRAGLQAVAAWRCETAQQANLPRPRILSDKATRAIARSLPQSLRRLRQVPGLPAGFTDRHGTALVQVVRAAVLQPRTGYPPRPDRLPSDDAHHARVHLALAVTWGRSLAAGIAAPLVASKAEVRAFVAGADSPLCSGWRHEFVGRDLAALFQGKGSVAFHAGKGLPVLS